jgi:hypothetical protein
MKLCSSCHGNPYEVLSDNGEEDKIMAEVETSNSNATPKTDNAQLSQSSIGNKAEGNQRPQSKRTLRKIAQAAERNSMTSKKKKKNFVLCH